MRILLAETDSSTSRALEVMLTHVGHNPYHTDLEEEAIDLTQLYNFDMIITSMDIISSLRKKQVVTPILVLSGDDSTEAKIKAFGHGADDYLTKPFHREELLARIDAIVRRVNGHATTILQFGDLTIDLTRKQVSVAGEHIHLTLKEYQILELLALRQNIIQTKEMLLDYLYGGMDEPELKIVDVFICKVRKKLKSASKLIETVWGRGYVLRTEKTVPST